MNTKKITIILTVCILTFFTMPTSAAHSDDTDHTEPIQDIDWIGQGFMEMHTTAYCMGTTTANGSKVHEGGCAASRDHIGDVAIIYTLDGEYLGMYECNDTGGTEGIKRGRVIDVYRTDLDRCKEYMEITDGKVYVKRISGDG